MGLLTYSFSYTLFPLLLLLDGAVNCRSSQKLEESVMVNVSDIAAEGVVQCLEELLKKCHLGSVDQVSRFEVFGNVIFSHTLAFSF